MPPADESGQLADGTGRGGALIAAYLAAVYRIGRGADAVVVRVGERVPAAVGGGRPLAFLTAWNPQSEARACSENRRALRRLDAVLRALGTPSLRAAAMDPHGGHAEPGRCVIGLPVEVLDALARLHGQNATLYAASGGVWRLRVDPERMGLSTLPGGVDAFGTPTHATFGATCPRGQRP